MSYAPLRERNGNVRNDNVKTHKEFTRKQSMLDAARATSPEVAQFLQRRPIAVLAFGAQEQHGPGLRSRYRVDGTCRG